MAALWKWNFRVRCHTLEAQTQLFSAVSSYSSLVMPLHEYVDVSLPDPCSRAAGSTLEIYTLSRTSVSPDPSRVRRKGSAHKPTQTLCTPPPEHFTVWWWWQVLWCANYKLFNGPKDQGCSHQRGISEYTLSHNIPKDYHIILLNGQPNSWVQFVDNYSGNLFL